MNQNVAIQMPKVKVLEGSGSMLYYHEVKTRQELSSLIASMLQAMSINPSLFETKSAIFKVDDTLYRIACNPFFTSPLHWVALTLYKLNEELKDLQLVNWDKGFNRGYKTEYDFKEYSFEDIWLTVQEEGISSYCFNPPKNDEEFVPHFPDPHGCYIWLNVSSPAFQALYAKLDGMAKTE